MSEQSQDLDVYAIPGQASIIDQIIPATGLTAMFGHTAEQVQARYPAAVRMSWAEWQAAAVARQQAPIVWQLTTAERYDEMLNVLPPAAWIGGAFLVGEPIDHCFATGRPRFEAYWQQGRTYLVSSRPITIAELRGQLQAR